MSIDQEDFDRLVEIRDSIKEMADEALQLVRQHGSKLDYDRAKSYWHPSIVMALSDDHMYLGNNSATLQECIDSLEDDINCDENEDEDEDGEDEDNL